MGVISGDLKNAFASTDTNGTVTGESLQSITTFTPYEYYWPYWQKPIYPGICPGCGRCLYCGHRNSPSYTITC
jgi:hypothetical protein